MAKKSERPIIIIRKTEDDSHGGHHGGGWKVAYADFMTAMMAFFLLLWILGASDEDQRRGLADYFAPTLFSLEGGFGVAKGAMAEVNGALNFQSGPVVAIVTPEFGKNGYSIIEVDSRNSLRNPADSDTPSENLTQSVPTDRAQIKENTQDQLEEILAEKYKSDQDIRFEKLKTEILQAMKEVPDLAPLAPNLIFDKTEEGLRIQIIDQEGQSMYAVGSARASGAALKLMTLVGRTVAKLPNDILISGHTDARPFSNSYTYSNWELSADRANATRRIFQGSGVNANRIMRISGLADTDLLKPEAPRHPSNRRISVVLQYQPYETSIGTSYNPVVDGQGRQLGVTDSEGVSDWISLGNHPHE